MVRAYFPHKRTIIYFPQIFILSFIKYYHKIMSQEKFQVKKQVLD